MSAPLLSVVVPTKNEIANVADCLACFREAAARCTNAAEHAWDGSWYLRGWWRDGAPLGAAGSPACAMKAQRPVRRAAAASSAAPSAVTSRSRRPAAAAAGRSARRPGRSRM